MLQSTASLYRSAQIWNQTSRMQLSFHEKYTSCLAYASIGHESTVYFIFIYFKATLYCTLAHEQTLQQQQSLLVPSKLEQARVETQHEPLVTVQARQQLLSKHSYPNKDLQVYPNPLNLFLLPISVIYWTKSESINTSTLTKFNQIPFY